MGGDRYIVPLDRFWPASAIGAKAQNLRWLHRYGLAIPSTYIVTWHAFEQYLADQVELVTSLQAELEQIILPGECYAIRSSANIEDAREVSFAGQFKTTLQARDLDAVLIAIWSIWATAQSLGVAAYRQRMAPDSPDSLKMAVMIQRMVEPVLSGVAFSRNPVTSLDETLIEAVPGLGTRLVQEGVTPLRWIRKWDQWIERPEECPVSEAVIEEVVTSTRRIASKLGQDVDLEWAYDGRQLYWLQLRPITSLDGQHIYTNKLSREMLPGRIRSLMLSTIVPKKVRRVSAMLEALSGEPLAEPERLVKAFYGQVYFEMNAFGRVFDRLGLPRDAMEVMFGVHPAPPGRKLMRMNQHMLSGLPRMLGLLQSERRYIHDFQRRYPALLGEYQTLNDQPLDFLDEAQLLARLDRLNELHESFFHASMVVLIFMHIANALLRSRLRRLGVEMDHFDLTAGLDELADYQPYRHLEALRRQFQALPAPVQEQARRLGYPAVNDLPEAAPFSTGLAAFLRRFGHFSDSGNDFAIPVWKETPGLIFDLAIQPPAEKETIRKLCYDDLAAQRRPGLLFDAAYRRARHYLLLRERTSSLYTSSIGLYRSLYRSLGERLCARGLLAQPDDIFDLTDGEVRQAACGEPIPGLAALLAARRAEIDAAPPGPLPSVIYGDEPPLSPVSARSRLCGTPTALGRYTGPARIVRSLSDSHRVQPGDVLVIPYSDVGWSPLFIHAGAVVSESGGILSHSSIIAREYGIPAVVSVAGALHIPDGAFVTVDGSLGEILVLEE